MPEKSVVLLIAFDFNHKGEWSSKTMEEINHNFSDNVQNKIRQELPRKESRQSACTLGVMLAPGGHTSGMVAHLQ